MEYSLYLINSTETWVIVAGLFLGAAIALLTRFPSSAKNPEKAHTRKISLIIFLMTAVIASALAGIIVAESVDKLGMELVYGGLISAAFFFFPFRFKKSVGIPVLVLFAGIIIFLGLFCNGWYAYRKGKPFTTAYVISVKEDSVLLEAQPSFNSDMPLQVKGKAFAFNYIVCTHSPWLSVLGAKALYAPVSISGFESGTFPFRSTTRRNNPPADIKPLETIEIQTGWQGSSIVRRFFTSNSELIPGIWFTEKTHIPIQAELFHTYLVTPVENKEAADPIEKCSLTVTDKEREIP